MPSPVEKHFDNAVLETHLARRGVHVSNASAAHVGAPRLRGFRIRGADVRGADDPW